MQQTQKNRIIGASAVAFLIVGAVVYWVIGRGPGGINSTPEVTYSGVGTMTQKTVSEDGVTWYASEANTQGDPNRLVFSKQSTCSFGERTYPCTMINLLEGDRAMIRGAKNGNSIDVVSMRFVGESTNRPVTKTVSVFYYNEVRDWEYAKNDKLTCSDKAVLPIEKELTVSPNYIEDTIRYLLLGEIRRDEEDQGFRAFFPQHSFELVRADLDGSTLSIEFSSVAEDDYGHPCTFEVIKTQIEKTALQFPEVKKVRFEPEHIVN